MSLILLTKASVLVNRLWASPTANTWMSLFTRSVSLVLVLPLVLRNFSTSEAAVWFIFSTVLAVQGVLNFGFSQSFSRLLAYARAGARVEDMMDLRQNRSISAVNEVNWDSIGRIVFCMFRVFLALAVVSLILMGILGSLAVFRPISMAGHQPSIWIAWSLIVLGSSLSFLTVHYVSVLQGMNRLAEWRRWETVTSLGAIFTAFFVLLVGGRILSLVIASQVWTVICFFTFRLLCRRIENGQFKQLTGGCWEKPVFKLVWNSAWKSGVTNILTFGLMQFTGVLQGQFGNPVTTTTYNFTLRIITIIGQVAQAPFLTKLPELARLRATGNLSGQLKVIRRGMRLTHWGIVVAVILGFIGIPIGIHLIGSKSVQFDPILWMLFSLYLFFDRQGSILQNIRNLTNQPMEHIGMIGYFIINVVIVVMFHHMLGMYIFPIAMVAAHILFYLWFSGMVAYPTIKVNSFTFERTVSFPPLLMLILVDLLVVLKSLNEPNSLFRWIHQ